MALAQKVVCFENIIEVEELDMFLLLHSTACDKLH